MLANITRVMSGEELCRTPILLHKLLGHDKIVRQNCDYFGVTNEVWFESSDMFQDCFRMVSRVLNGNHEQSPETNNIGM